MLWAVVAVVAIELFDWLDLDGFILKHLIPWVF